MNAEKLIVFGCEDAKQLPVVINSISKSAFYTSNIITATRQSELTSLISTLQPNLVILYFSDNQPVLNELIQHLHMPDLPILCINKKGTSVPQWSGKAIVFTFPVLYDIQEHHLGAMINSILHISRESKHAVPVKSLADAAMQDHQQHSNRDMSKVILELDQKVDVLLKVKEKIAGLFSRVDDPVRAELMHIVNAIKKSVNDNKLWEDFKLYFVKTNPNFLFLLANKYPSLTQVDLKYCCYLKMNMSNDDITALLGINQESVRTHKYRLKKKMALSSNQSLSTYLQSFN